jgi:hypothetical protein
MSLCGVSILSYAPFFLLLAFKVQYRSPDLFSLFVWLPIAEQIVSYFEMRLLSQSIKKA